MGQEETGTPSNAVISLSNWRGASITFTETDGSWCWTGLKTPGAPEGWSVTDEGIQVAAADGTEVLAPGWSLVENGSNKLVFEQTALATGLRVRRVFSFGPALNVVRIETWVQSTGGEKVLVRAGLLGLRVEGESFRETGPAPASFPLFGRSLFVGLEHVSGECRAEGGTARLWQAPHLKVDEAWQFVVAAVVGWPRPSKCSLLEGEAQIREAFLQYLDTIRIKPERIELHTNTWWTLPLPYSEKDVIKDIEALRQGFTERTGMFFDSYALDLGWSDRHSIWRLDQDRFPNGLRPINERLAALGCRMGLWVSPGCVYPEGLDNEWLEFEGYEMTPFEQSPYPGRTDKVACFALGGRYQQEFKDSIVTYAKRYGLGHVKFDFMAHLCDVAEHGHATSWDSAYAIDAGLADVLDSLRAVNPGMALEPLCCGYPPSPWWTTHTPFLLGPVGDDLPVGRVPCPEWMESLITGRDRAYRAGQEDWIMPTQALETFDIVVQTPGDFQNMAVMAIGRGRWFISTYLNPDLMKPTDWDFLAALVKWTRENKEFLGNARMIGGRPEDREAYGFMFHNAGKDIFCARNPWIEERSIDLPACASVTEPRELRMIYPRRATLARMEPGQAGPRIVLAPYETVMLETVPAGEVSELLPLFSPPEASVFADVPRRFNGPKPQEPGQAGSFHYGWTGSLTVPDVIGAELCILLEGAPPVDGATCKVSLAGSEATVRKSGSEGQFSAAGEPSPEHWTWFIVPVAPGDTTFQIDLDVPLENASIGVYLRGFTRAGNEAAPENVSVFPAYHPEQRAWSQTLLPSKTSTSEDGTEPDNPPAG